MFKLTFMCIRLKTWNKGEVDPTFSIFVTNTHKLYILKHSINFKVKCYIINIIKDYYCDMKSSNIIAVN